MIGGTRVAPSESPTVMVNLIKPLEIGHFDRKKHRHAIYSLDFQPNGSRLATGSSDCCVKIWDYDVLLTLDKLDQTAIVGGTSNSPCNVAANSSSSTSKKEKEEEEKKTSLLTTISVHTKSVNTVRWNKEGTLLASGSDDCYILIYKHTPGSYNQSSFGTNASKNAKNKENWSRCATLQGHTMDVLDIDWSPRGFLASASIDNTVMIWDCKSTGQPGSAPICNAIHVLRQHENYVKGVSFDPLGKYLLSSGSDNLLCVWDADTWTLAEKLEGPMKDSQDVSCSLFRRVSWAPDGQGVAATACTKSNRPVGMIIRRGTWESVTDLVGHQQPSLSTRFCPSVMLSYPAEGTKESEASQSMEDVEDTVDKSPKGATSPRRGGRKRKASGGSAPSPAPAGTAAATEQDASEKESPIVVCRSTKSQPFCVVGMGDAVGVISVWTSHCSKAVLVLKDAFKGRNQAVTDITWIADRKRTIMAASSMDGSTVIVDFGTGLGTHMNDTQLDGHFRKYFGRGKDESSTEEAPLITDPMALQYLSSDNKRAKAYPGIDLSPQRTSTAPEASTVASEVSRTLDTSQVKTMQRVRQGKDGKKRIQPVLIQGQEDMLGDNGSTVSAVATLPSRSSLGVTSGNGMQGTALGPPVSSRMNSVLGSAERNMLTGNDLSATPSSAAQPASLTMVFKQEDIQHYVRLPAIAEPSQPLRCFVKQRKHLNRSVGEPPSAFVSMNSDVTHILSATRQFKPAALVSRHATSLLTKVALSQSLRCVPSATEGANTPSSNMIWESPVVAEVVCMVGLIDSLKSSTSDQALRADGLCVMGCSDGTLHLLSLESGVRVCPPLVLGPTITHVDLVEKPADGGAEGALLLAMTADGSLWVWELGLAQGVASLHCKVHTSIKPVVTSMQIRARAVLANAQNSSSSNSAVAVNTAPSPAKKGGSSKTSKNSSTSAAANKKSGGSNSNSVSGAVDDSVRVTVERVSLNEKGLPMVFVMAKGATGGDWQGFAFSEVTKAWIRVVDLRHLMSNAFHVSSSAAPTANAQSLFGISESAESESSMEQMQSEAALKGGVTTREVLQIAAANSNATRVASTTPGAVTKAASLAKYSAWVTLSHLEDRICMAFAVGSRKEAYDWISEWTQWCCRNQMHDRVRWLASRLLACHTAQSSLTGMTVHEGNGSVLFDWSKTINRPLDVYKTVILPAVGGAGQAISLLGELTDALGIINGL